MQYRTDTLFIVAFVLAVFAFYGRVFLPDGDSDLLADRGVTKYIPDKMASGMNLFCSREEPVAYLMNAEGEVVHHWRDMGPHLNGWHHIEPGQNGNLFVIKSNSFIEKIDKNSEILWRTQGKFHHDFDFYDNGEIVTLLREEREVEYRGEKIRVLDDVIVELSSDGQRVRRYPLFEIVRPLIPQKRINEVARYLRRVNPRVLEPDSPADIFHTNAIEIVGDRMQRMEKGRLVLISLRDINQLAIIDLDSEKVVWSYGEGVLDHQHDPTILSNGNILILDNGRARKSTRVLEIDPTSKRVVWSYGEDDRRRFYTNRRGGAQRLANGNTLVTVGEAGRAWEITHEKEVVWRFKNPRFFEKRYKPGKRYRETIYRMNRYPLETFAPLMSG